MKYRCPYCKKEFGPELAAVCPACGKAMMIPSKARGAEDPPKRRKRISRETGEPPGKWGMNPFMIYSALMGNRSFIAVLIVALIFIVVMLLSGGKEKLGPRPQPLSNKLAKAEEETRVLRTALEYFRRDCGRYPSSNEGFFALLNRPNSLDEWKGPYITVYRKDPWNHFYLYRLSNDMAVVSSAGFDGKEGTADDIVCTEPVTNFPADSSE